MYSLVLNNNNESNRSGNWKRELDKEIVEHRRVVQNLGTLCRLSAINYLFSKFVHNI